LYGEEIDPMVIKAEEIREKYLMADKYNHQYISPEEMEIYFAGTAIRLAYDIKRISQLEESGYNALIDEWESLRKEQLQFLKDQGCYKDFLDIIKDETVEVAGKFFDLTTLYGEGVDKLAEFILKEKVPLSDAISISQGLWIFYEKLEWSRQAQYKNKEYLEKAEEIREALRKHELRYIELKQLIPLMENLSNFYKNNAFEKWFTNFKLNTRSSNKKLGIHAYHYRDFFDNLKWTDIWNKEGTDINKKNINKLLENIVDLKYEPW
jgi:hypothetical protein